MARDITCGSARELIRFFNNVIVTFEETQNIFNSTSHVVEVMNASFAVRCLLKLGSDEAKETCDVFGEHRDAPITDGRSLAAGFARYEADGSSGNSTFPGFIYAYASRGRARDS